MVTAICVVLITFGILVLLGVAFLALLSGIAAWLIDPLCCVLIALLIVKLVKTFQKCYKKHKEAEDIVEDVEE